MAQAYNQVSVVCEAADCPYDHSTRTVAYPLMGQGTFAKVPLYCECGSSAEMKIVSGTD